LKKGDERGIWTRTGFRLRERKESLRAEPCEAWQSTFEMNEIASSLYSSQ
jgi:hypothetical protein